MIVNLNVTLTIDTDKLDSFDRLVAIAECEQAGFPVTEENIAWYIAEDALANMRADFPGVKAELGG